MLDDILLKLLIVALSTVTGVSAQITVRPANVVVLWDSPAEFNCTSASGRPGWTYADYGVDSTTGNATLADEGCEYSTRFGPDQLRLDKGEATDTGVCNMAVLKPDLTMARKYTCRSGAYKSSGVLIGIRPELTCDAAGAQLTCRLSHSNYGDNVAAFQWLVVAIVWTDPLGKRMPVDGSGSTGAEAVGVAELPPGATVNQSRPYTCTVEVRLDYLVQTEEFSRDIRLPPTQLECSYPALDLKKAVEGTTRNSSAPPSNWDASVDGIETVWRLTGVLVAFLFAVY